MPGPRRQGVSVFRLGSGGCISSGVVSFIATLQGYDYFLLVKVSFCRTLSCIMAWYSRTSAWGVACSVSLCQGNPSSLIASASLSLETSALPTMTLVDDEWLLVLLLEGHGLIKYHSNSRVAETTSSSVLGHFYFTPNDI